MAPILAKGKTDSGRRWAYVRDVRPFGGAAAPATLFYGSRDRTKGHPEHNLSNFSGLLQADAYSGCNGRYDPDRSPGPIIPTLYWVHARLKFFELAYVVANSRRGKDAASISPIALEAFTRIDAIFCY